MQNGIEIAVSDGKEIEMDDLKKPIDLVHLSRQTFGNKELEKEVLGLFVSHSSQCLDRIQETQSDEAFADIAHSIKGSARAIGAWALANLAETFERLARAGKLEDKTSALFDLKDGVKATNQYIALLQKGM